MQSPDAAGAAERPHGDTYTTEVGEVLFSLQALLLRESQGGVVDLSFPVEDQSVDRPRWALEEDVAADAAPAASVPAAAQPPAEVTVLPEAEPTPAYSFVHDPEPEPVVFDPSTGAPNSNALVREIERHGSRIGSALVSLDITPIGDIRAQHGDAIAEAILRVIVEAVPFAMRAEDQIYRTGLDELTLCVPGADLSDAAVMSLRLQLAVKDVLVRRELPAVILSIRPYQQVAA